MSPHLWLCVSMAMYGVLNVVSIQHGYQYFVIAQPICRALSCDTHWDIIGVIKLCVTLTSGYMWHLGIVHGHIDSVILSVISYVLFRIMTGVTIKGKEWMGVAIAMCLVQRWSITNVWVLMATAGFTVTKYLNIYYPQSNTPELEYFIAIYLCWYYQPDVWPLTMVAVVLWCAIITSQIAYHHGDVGSLSNWVWAKITITAMIEYVVHQRAIGWMELIPMVWCYYLHCYNY